MALEINVNIEAKGLTEAINKLAEALSNIGIGFEADPKMAEEEKPSLTFMPEDVEKVEGTMADLEQVAQTYAEAPVAAVEEPEAPQMVNPMPEPVEEPVKAVTRQELFTRCSSLIQGKKIQMAQMSGILQKFGAASLPALKDEQVQMFWEELDKMGV